MTCLCGHESIFPARHDGVAWELCEDCLMGLGQTEAVIFRQVLMSNTLDHLIQDDPQDAA